MASRGHLGGLAAATPQAVRVLDAAGCDVVLVETVGVGQAEVEVASLADTTLVLLAPGMGDGIQAAKAGILEIADVLRGQQGRPGRRRRRPYATCKACSRSAGGAGAGRVAAADRRRSRPAGGASRSCWPRWTSTRAGWSDPARWSGAALARAAAEVEAIAVAALRARIGDLRGCEALDDAGRPGRRRQLDPYAAADQLTPWSRAPPRH